MKRMTAKFAEYLQKFFAVMGGMLIIGIGILVIFHPTSFKYQYLPSIIQMGLGVLLVYIPGYLFHRAFRRKSEGDLRCLAISGCVFGIVFGLIFVLDETARLHFGASVPVRPMSLILLIASVVTLVTTIASERKVVQRQGG